MPKVNVYLPGDLADAARAAELSLSPICQQAIREELRRMEARQAATSELEAVAARLRGTLDKEATKRHREGHADGVAWAREYATATELRGLAFALELGQDRFDAPHSITAFFSAKQNENVISVSLDFEEIEGDPHYWDGFIEGADKVLEAVAPLL